MEGYPEKGVASTAAASLPLWLSWTTVPWKHSPDGCTSVQCRLETQSVDGCTSAQCRLETVTRRTYPYRLETLTVDGSTRTAWRH